MILEVVFENNAQPGQGVPKSQIKNMVDKYRQFPRGLEDGNGIPIKDLTHLAHFPLKQIIEFLLKNNIVTLSNSVADIQNTSNGLNLYFAQHIDTSDCPSGPLGQDFIGRNTIVLVNTEWVNDKWRDMLVETKNFVLIPGDLEGNGMDKTELCPPQCDLFDNPL